MNTCPPVSQTFSNAHTYLDPTVDLGGKEGEKEDKRETHHTKDQEKKNGIEKESEINNLTVQEARKRETGKSEIDSVSRHVERQTD